MLASAMGGGRIDLGPPNARVGSEALTENVRLSRQFTDYSRENLVNANGTDANIVVARTLAVIASPRLAQSCAPY
jgi:hypothetical protein